MALMDRIYCDDFLDLSYPKQLELVENVRIIRSSAIHAAMLAGNKLTKSAKKNIAKGKGGRKRKPKDLKKVATAALSKLSPEQIALIQKQLQG